MVVAETRDQALTAAEAVDVTYDVLPWVADTAAAAEPDAPRLWDELPDNILVDSSFGDVERTDAAFTHADHVVTMRTHVGRVTGVPLEPRAALGQYDAATGRYTLYAGSGGAVRQKRELAEVLGEAPENMRVLSFDVGGNFGTRNRVYVEAGLVLWASRKHGRPVKFRAERSEAFLTDYQGRDLVTEVSLAIDEDGKFLAMRASNLSNVGSRCVSLSPLSKGSGLITGSYDIPYATLRSRAVYSNTMPTQAYRSSGRPEVTFAIERLIDKAARELGFDRLELRRRNLVRPQQMPYVNAVGSTYDSGEYETNMDRLLALADWQGVEARRAEAKTRGKILGVGFANYVESSIGTPKERADVIVRPDGVEVVIGTQPAGQGHETSFAQVTADLLGVPFDNVTITLGDTDVVSAGGGTHSGRSMRHASTVLALASEDLIAKGRALAAHYLDVALDAVVFEDGVFRVADRNTFLTWFDLAGRAEDKGLPESLRGGLKVRRDSEMHTPVFPNGACACEIEIDPETGGLDIVRYATVDDVGRCINPLIVHGQTHGGIAQGVGQALWEQCVIDPGSGQPTSGSLMDYGMPRFDNMPSFKTQIVEVLSPTNPFGVKAGGEGGTTPAPAVIMSAVEDALSEFGPVDFEMPATALKIWSAIQKGRARRRSPKAA
jgi:carbon-monoxide dehydrogenase large subunit